MKLLQTVSPLLGMYFMLPQTAFAHDGHGGVGLFHHLMDIAPALLLVMLVLWGVNRVFKRK